MSSFVCFQGNCSFHDSKDNWTRQNGQSLKWAHYSISFIVAYSFPKPCTYFNARLTDGLARIFPISLAYGRESNSHQHQPETFLRTLNQLSYCSHGFLKAKSPQTKIIYRTCAILLCLVYIFPLSNIMRGTASGQVAFLQWSDTRLVQVMIHNLILKSNHLFLFCNIDKDLL